MNRAMWILVGAGLTGCFDAGGLPSDTGALAADPAVTATPEGDPGAATTSPVVPASSNSALVPFGSETELSQALAWNPVNYSYPTWSATIFGATIGLGAPTAAPTAPAGPGAPIAPTSAPTAPTGPSGPSGGASTSSSTTIQEERVDEADVVKHDGRYLYIAKSDTLRVVDAHPLANLAQVGGASLPGTGARLYLHDGRAIVLSGWSGGTAVSVFSLADPVKPALCWERFFDGQLAGSRMIDGILHLTLTNGAWYYNGLALSGTAAEQCAQFLPNVRTRRWEAGVELLSARSVLHPRDHDIAWCSLLTICSIDTTDPAAAIRALGVMERQGLDYVSESALYLVRGGAGWWTATGKTGIHQFRFTAGGPVYTGSGAVDGTILNSYSLGEYQGNLRVATQTQTLTNVSTWWGTWQTWVPETNVFVLAPRSGSLSVIGSVTKIEPGETLFACRFLETRGYLITAVVRRDPLIAVDLADPTKPTVRGKFTYTGLSQFLYPISATRLVGVGPQVAGLASGVELSLFDVSDLDHPTRIASAVVSQYGTTRAAFEPHAFTWYGARNWLAIPIEEWVSTGGTSALLGRVEVYAVQNDAFVAKATVPVQVLGLSSWGQTPFIRSVFLDDDVLGITENGVDGLNVPAGRTPGSITVS